MDGRTRTAYLVGLFFAMAAGLAWAGDTPPPAGAQSSQVLNYLIHSNPAPSLQQTSSASHSLSDVFVTPAVDTAVSATTGVATSIIQCTNPENIANNVVDGIFNKYTNGGGLYGNLSIGNYTSSMGMNYKNFGLPPGNLNVPPPNSLQGAPGNGQGPGSSPFTPISPSNPGGPVTAPIRPGVPIKPPVGLPRQALPATGPGNPAYYQPSGTGSGQPNH